MARKLEKSSDLKEILTCSVCLDILSNPFTLKECLHSFCKKCLDGLNRKLFKGVNGVDCPLCWTFSPHESLVHSFFIEGLLETHSAVSGTVKKVCRGCHKGLKPEWKCIDCKLELCDQCKENHTLIPLLQTHIIKPLSEMTENEIILDKLVFCSIHHDEPVKFNCKECEILLCIKCKVIDHESHKTETIESALERLLPLIKANKDKITSGVEQMHKAIQDTDEKLDETKKAYKTCSDEIHIKSEEYIKRIRLREKLLIKELQLKEEEETAKLENNKVNLEHRKKTCQNLCHLVNVSIENARNTSLLAEFQSELFGKVKNVSIKPVDIPVSGRIQHPKLTSDVALDQAITERAIGKLEYTCVNIIHGNDEIKNPSEVSFCIEENLVSKTFIKDKEVSLSSLANRFTFIKDEIWIPIRCSDILCIYSEDCSLKKTLQFPGKSPKAVEQLTDDTVVMACKATGLYEISMDGEIIHKIANSTYTDIAIYEQCLYAYDLKEDVINVFSKQEPEHQLHLTKTFKVPRIISQCNSNKMHNSMIISNDRVYVSSFTGNVIQTMTLSGDEINSININNNWGIDWTSLCVVDKCNHILVSGYNSETLHIWDGQNTMKPVTLDPTPACITDCLINKGYIWTLSETVCFSKLKRYTKST